MPQCGSVALAAISRRSCVQPLAVLEPAQLLDRADRDVAVRADPEPPAGLEKRGQIEQTVAEIGLGGRAKTGDRAASCEARRLVVVHVGGVDQAPAGSDRSDLEQMGDRASAAPFEALAHLARLLGDVDVDRRGRVEPVDQGDHLLERRVRHRAQRMRRDAEPMLQIRAKRGVQSLQ